MFCSNCGARLENGTRFCPFCGKHVTDGNEAPAPGVQPMATESPAPGAFGTAVPPVTGVSVAARSSKPGASMAPLEKTGFFMIAGATLLMILGNFLPFISINVMGLVRYNMNYLGGGNIPNSSGVTGDGLILLIFGVIVLILLALHYFKIRMSGPYLIISIITGIVGLVLPLADSSRMVKALGGKSALEGVNIFGVGYYLILASSVILLVGVFLVIRGLIKKA